jgi:hypothetical protein
MTFSKNIKRVFASLLTVALIFSAIPFGNTVSKLMSLSASAASNKQIIFNFVVDEMGLNSAAACGILANIECESDFNPNLYGDNGTSYGICQWHSGRFTALQNYCANNGYAWDSIYGQLQYLKYELLYCKGDTGSVINYLQVENTADGAYQAGYNWCYYFERPANKAVKSQNRGTLARDTYWPNFKRVDEMTDYSTGDINNDGSVNSSDALLVIEYSVGKVQLTDEQLKAADVNGNGKINSEDALHILKVATGAEGFEDFS